MAQFTLKLLNIHSDSISGIKDSTAAQRKTTTLKCLASTISEYSNQVIDNVLTSSNGNICYSYNEKLNIHQNAQKQLTFTMDRYVVREGSRDENPFVRNIHNGSQLLLIDKFNNNYLFIVNNIQYTFKEDNMVYNYTCQDSFTYQLSRQNDGYSIENNAEEEDFLGAHNIDWWARKIVSECHISYKYISLATPLYISTSNALIETAKNNNVKKQIKAAILEDSTYYETFAFSGNGTSNSILISAGEQLSLQLQTYEYYDEANKTLLTYFWFEPKQKDNDKGLYYSPYSDISNFSLTNKGDAISSILNVEGPTYDDDTITLIPSVPSFFQQVFAEADWQEDSDAEFTSGMFATTMRHNLFNQNKTAVSPSIITSGTIYAAYQGTGHFVSSGHLPASSGEYLFIPLYTDTTPSHKCFEFKKFYPNITFQNILDDSQYSEVVYSGTTYTFNAQDWQLAIYRIESASSESWTENSNYWFVGINDELPAECLQTSRYTYAAFARIPLGESKSGTSITSYDIYLDCIRTTSNEEEEFAEIADNCPWLENRLIDFSYYKRCGIINTPEYNKLMDLITNNLRKVNGRLLMYASQYYAALHNKTKVLADLNTKLDSLGASFQSEILTPYIENGLITDPQTFIDNYNIVMGTTDVSTAPTSVLLLDSSISDYLNKYITVEQRFLKNLYKFDQYFNAPSSFLPQGGLYHHYTFTLSGTSYNPASAGGNWTAIGFSQPTVQKIDSNFNAFVNTGDDTGLPTTNIYMSISSGLKYIASSTFLTKKKWNDGLSATTGTQSKYYIAKQHNDDNYDLISSDNPYIYNSDASYYEVCFNWTNDGSDSWSDIRSAIESGGTVTAKDNRSIYNNYVVWSVSLADYNTISFTNLYHLNFGTENSITSLTIYYGTSTASLNITDAMKGRHPVTSYDIREGYLLKYALYYKDSVNFSETNLNSKIFYTKVTDAYYPIQENSLEEPFNKNHLHWEETGLVINNKWLSNFPKALLSWKTLNNHIDSIERDNYSYPITNRTESTTYNYIDVFNTNYPFDYLSKEEVGRSFAQVPVLTWKAYQAFFNTSEIYFKDFNYDYKTEDVDSDNIISNTDKRYYTISSLETYHTTTVVNSNNYLNYYRRVSASPDWGHSLSILGSSAVLAGLSAGLTSILTPAATIAYICHLNNGDNFSNTGTTIRDVFKATTTSAFDSYQPNKTPGTISKNDFTSFLWYSNSAHSFDYNVYAYKDIKDVYIGSFSNTVSHTKGEVVYNDSSNIRSYYQCILSYSKNNSISITNTTYWKKIITQFSANDVHYCNDIVYPSNAPSTYYRCIKTYYDSSINYNNPTYWKQIYLTPLSGIWQPNSYNFSNYIIHTYSSLLQTENPYQNKSSKMNLFNSYTDNAYKEFLQKYFYQTSFWKNINITKTFNSITINKDDTYYLIQQSQADNMYGLYPFCCWDSTDTTYNGSMPNLTLSKHYQEFLPSNSYTNNTCIARWNSSILYPLSTYIQTLDTSAYTWATNQKTALLKDVLTAVYGVEPQRSSDGYIEMLIGDELLKFVIVRKEDYSPLYWNIYFTQLTALSTCYSWLDYRDFVLNHMSTPLYYIDNDSKLDLLTDSSITDLLYGFYILKKDVIEYELSTSYSINNRYYTKRVDSTGKDIYNEVNTIALIKNGNYRYFKYDTYTYDTFEKITETTSGGVTYNEIPLNVYQYSYDGASNKTNVVEEYPNTLFKWDKNAATKTGSISINGTTYNFTVEDLYPEWIDNMSNGRFWYTYKDKLSNSVLMQQAAVIESELSGYWNTAYNASLYCKWFLPSYWQPRVDGEDNAFASDIISISQEDSGQSSTYYTANDLSEEVTDFSSYQGYLPIQSGKSYKTSNSHSTYFTTNFINQHAEYISNLTLDEDFDSSSATRSLNIIQLYQLYYNTKISPITIQSLKDASASLTLINLIRSSIAEHKVAYLDSNFPTINPSAATPIEPYIISWTWNKTTASYSVSTTTTYEREAVIKYYRINDSVEHTFTADRVIFYNDTDSSSYGRIRFYNGTSFLAIYDSGLITDGGTADKYIQSISFKGVHWSVAIIQWLMTMGTISIDSNCCYYTINNTDYNTSAMSGWNYSAYSDFSTLVADSYVYYYYNATLLSSGFYYEDATDATSLIYSLKGLRAVNTNYNTSLVHKYIPLVAQQEKAQWYNFKYFLSSDLYNQYISNQANTNFLDNEYTDLSTILSSNQTLSSIADYLKLNDMSGYWAGVGQYADANYYPHYYSVETGGTTWQDALTTFVTTGITADKFGGLYDMAFRLLSDSKRYINQTTDEYDKYLKRHNEIWDELYKLYPNILTEQNYKNETATTSTTLYNMASTAFKDYLKPESSYSITTIDVNNLQGYEGQDLKIGDPIKIKVDDYYDLEDDYIADSLKQLLFISDISYTLRNDKDISFTVDTVKYGDKVIKELVKLIR